MSMKTETRSHSVALQAAEIIISSDEPLENKNTEMLCYRKSIIVSKNSTTHQTNNPVEQ